MLSKVLCLGAGSGDDNCGGFLADTFLIRCEPSGLLCKSKSSVECSEFPANVGKGVGCRNSMHKELCRGGVQVDCGDARDEVEELGDLAVQRGRLHCIHGGKHQVVCWIAFHTLNEGGIQGSIDAVPDGDSRGCEGRAVSFDHESALSEGEALLG